MKVDSGSDWMSINRAAANRAYDAGASAAFAAAMAETGRSAGDGADRPDFTSMTRLELRDWVNEEIRSGRMTVEESAPFLPLTFRMDETGTCEIPAETDAQRFDFLAKTRSNIDAALSMNDNHFAERLRFVLDYMQSRQSA